MRSGSKPWFFIALVTAAIGISYFDRQALPVAISAIQRNIHGTVFALVGSLHAIAFAILLLTSGVLRPPGTSIFHNREKLVSS
jgi:MFS transporter, ACS family, hexuronate transporter